MKKIIAVDDDDDDDDDMPYLETEEEAAERIADFHEKKGKGYVDLPILLSKLNINSSKELISNVKQLVKILYDNKQITKQVYNILNKAITYVQSTTFIKMTRKEQVKILDDKIEANKRQYDLDRINAEMSAYSSGDLPKFEYLSKKDFGYKPDAVQKVKFEYSPIGKLFTDGLAKEYRSEKAGLFKKLKNIEDNLVEVDDDNNKIGIFRIIKDIKDKGIKIDNDNEAIREIRERIKELIDDGVKVNNFNEMKEEIMEHIKNLKAQGINVEADEDKINDLVSKISDIKDKIIYIYLDSEIDKFLDKYEDKNIYVRYNKNKNKFDTEEITKSLKKLRNKLINFSEFNEEYNKFMDNVIKFEYYKSEKEPDSVSPNKQKMIRYAKSLKDIVDFYKPQLGNVTSKKGEGLKTLTNKQILNRLSILPAQIEAGHNSKKLKNEIRQILYSLYRSRVLTKIVYAKLIKSIRA